MLSYVQEPMTPDECYCDCEDCTSDDQGNFLVPQWEMIEEKEAKTLKKTKSRKKLKVPNLSKLFSKKNRSRRRRGNKPSSSFPIKLKFTKGWEEVYRYNKLTILKKVIDLVKEEYRKK